MEACLKHILSRKSDIFLVVSKTGADYAWYYVLLEKSKKHVFSRILGNKPLQLADYGKILYSGWGQTPPDEIRMAVEKEFE
jgi:hypothetical protein